MTDLSDLAVVHEACPAGAAQTAVGGSCPSVVVSSPAEVALYFALPSTHQQPVYNRSHVLEEALERPMAAVVLVVLVSAADQSAQTVATFGVETGVPVASLLLLLAHLLYFAFLPLHFVVLDADAAVLVCSAAICLRHPAVKVPPAAGCRPDVVLHHVTHFFAVVQAPAAVCLFVAAVHHAASVPGSRAVAAVTTVLAAAELAWLVVAGHHLPVDPVPAYSAGVDVTHSLMAAAAASVETVSAAD